jgi:hypothetical protein
LVAGGSGAHIHDARRDTIVSSKNASQVVVGSTKLLSLVGTAVLVLTCSLQACSSSSNHPPSIGGGGTGGGVSGSGTGTQEGGAENDGAVVSTTDGGDCLSGTFDAEIETMLGDVNEIGGTVSFASTVAGGHQIAVTVQSTTGTPSFTTQFTFPAARDEFTYRIHGLPAGTYTVQAQADITATTSVTDPGDLDGFFGGTTLAPIHTRADGTSITVPPCKGGADFGLGPKM